jgi:hypothetical protein
VLTVHFNLLCSGFYEDKTFKNVFDVPMWSDFLSKKRLKKLPEKIERAEILYKIHTHNVDSLNFEAKQVMF